MLHKKPHHDWNSSMAALLILGGMVLCLLGWLWLWQRTAREHWVWALTGVLPPLALLSGLINGRVALLPLLVFVSGLGILADRKSTRLNSSHVRISYAVFCLKKKK